MREIFTEEVKTKGRKYFFDVKETESGIRMISINERKKMGGGVRHDRIMIFEEDLDLFKSALKKTEDFLSGNGGGDV